MKIYSFYLLLFLLTGTVNKCLGSSGQNVGPDQAFSDTARKISVVSVASNPLTKGLTDIELYDIYRDSLFLINKDRLLKVNLMDGSVTTNPKVNLFLAKQLKANNYVRQVLIKDDYYYFSFLNELYRVSREGVATKLFVNSIFINQFDVINDRILISSIDTIKIIDIKGKTLAVQPFGFTDGGYIKSYQGITYAALPEDSVSEFQVGASAGIEIKKFAPVSATVFQEPFIAYATKDYFVAFDYSKRDMIYVIKKNAGKGEFVKKIDIRNYKLTPSQAEIQKEEGNPDLKIAHSNGTFYVFALTKGKLSLFSFTL